MTILETERLILRHWKEEDAGALYSYAKDKEVGPPAGWKPHESIEESLEILKNMFIPYGVFAIVLKETETIIGTIGLEPDRRRPDIESKELGYSIGWEYWGRGLMVEAAGAIIEYGFKNLGLEVISICHGKENKRSQRVIEKCGFVYEGIERRAYRVYDGSIRDSLCYSMLREEWEESN